MSPHDLGQQLTPLDTPPIMVQFSVSGPTSTASSGSLAVWLPVRPAMVMQRPHAPAPAGMGGTGTIGSDVATVTEIVFSSQGYGEDWPISMTMMSFPSTFSGQ